MVLIVFQKGIYKVKQLCLRFKTSTEFGNSKLQELHQHVSTNNTTKQRSSIAFSTFKYGCGSSPPNKRTATTSPVPTKVGQKLGNNSDDSWCYLLHLEHRHTCQCQKPQHYKYCCLRNMGRNLG